MIPTKNDRIGFGGGRDVRTMLSVVFQIHFLWSSPRFWESGKEQWIEKYGTSIQESKFEINFNFTIGGASRHVTVPMATSSDDRIALLVASQLQKIRQARVGHILQ